MDIINRLTDYLTRLPGIGPRQGRRLAYFLIRQDRRWIEEFVDLVREAKQGVKTCQSCFRHFISRSHDTHICDICADTSRSKAELMVVEKDVDLENIERSGVFRGLYLVLGGTITALEAHPERKIRIKELVKTADERAAQEQLKEIILALSATPDGEDTAEHLETQLGSLASKYNVKITKLGRGLSTGSELEYSDAETIKNAFQSRS